MACPAPALQFIGETLHSSQFFFTCRNWHVDKHFDLTIASYQMLILIRVFGLPIRSRSPRKALNMGQAVPPIVKPVRRPPTAVFENGPITLSSV